jgi:hypothetical protein
MQVNSAQDYLTRYKRRIIAATFYSTPPEQKDKTNGVFLSAMANNAQVRQRHQAPTVVSAWGGVPGGAAYFSLCTSNCSLARGAPGTFQTVNTKDFISRQALRPIGIRSTISQQ